MKSIAVLATVLACLSPQSDSTRPVAAASATLTTSNRIDGLSDEAKIVLATNYILNLEPGVTARRTDDSLILSTYDGAKLRIASGNDRIKLPTPTLARLTPDGWDLGTGKIFPASEIRVSRDAQDDTDNNLKSMQEAAKKLKSKNLPSQDNQVAQKKLRTRWLFQENPMPTAELFNTAAIQQLTHLSPVGF